MFSRPPSLLQSQQLWRVLVFFIPLQSKKVGKNIAKGVDSRKKKARFEGTYKSTFLTGLWESGKFVSMSNMSSSTSE